MPYKRRYRRRRRRKHKSSTSKIKAIVKKEVGKTRENQKMVSYLSWSSIPNLIDDTAGNRQGLVFSLTGGMSPQDNQTVLTPGSYTDKSLFTLLPAGSQLTGTNNVQQAGQGGNAMEQDSAGAVTSTAIGGIHQLEGREAFLKTWYGSLIFSNSPQQVQNPRSCFVRMLVIQTRRPLASEDLAQQVFLQNHAVAAMTAGVADEPETVCSYINRDIVSKVFVDKLIKLTGPSGNDAGASSAQLNVKKLKIRINKKCRWTYYYSTRDPVQTDESLSYMGPFIYGIFLSNQSDAENLPKVAMNTMLTFLDD